MWTNSVRNVPCMAGPLTTYSAMKGTYVKKRSYVSRDIVHMADHGMFCY